MNRAVVAITGAALAALLGLVPAGALGQCCGDCNGDGAVTVDEILTAVNRALTTCADDGICGMEVLPAQPLRTGQTTSYGTGSDGDLQKGVARQYTDNGDGTITDKKSGLMWEKKDQNVGGIHNLDNDYTWGITSALYPMNGTIVTTFLAALNTAPCFAGHCDWRIPNRFELETIVNLQNFSPAVDSAFNTSCAADCTVDGAGGTTKCSCTQSGSYWSSTTYQNDPTYAWGVAFNGGYVDVSTKTSSSHVRAVRAGL